MKTTSILTSRIPTISCVLYEYEEKLKTHSLLRSTTVNQLYTTGPVFIRCLSIRKNEKKFFRSACIQPEHRGSQEVKSIH